MIDQRGHETFEAGSRLDAERDLSGRVDSDGRLTWMSAGWEAALGWTRRELMSRPITEFIHPADREAVAIALGHTDGSIDAIVLESRFRVRGGQWRGVRWRPSSNQEEWIPIGLEVAGQQRAPMTAGVLVALLAVALLLAIVGVARLVDGGSSTTHGTPTTWGHSPPPGAFGAPIAPAGGPAGPSNRD